VVNNNKEDTVGLLLCNKVVDIINKDHLKVDTEDNKVDMEDHLCKDSIHLNREVINSNLIHNVSLKVDDSKKEGRQLAARMDEVERDR